MSFAYENDKQIQS